MNTYTKIFAEITSQLEKRHCKDNAGHLRWKYLITCPQCNNQRWVRADTIRRGITKGINKGGYTKICHNCHAKILGNASYRESHSRWKGGKYVSSTGYICVSVPSGDKLYSMTTKAGYILEHRLVMARYLNRPLSPWEIVHHINGNRQDNKLDNLELIPANRYHVIDSATKSRIQQLQNRIKRQEDKIQKLKRETGIYKRLIKSMQRWNTNNEGQEMGEDSTTKALRIIASNNICYPKDFARLMWADSPSPHSIKTWRAAGGFLGQLASQGFITKIYRKKGGQDIHITDKGIIFLKEAVEAKPYNKQEAKINGFSEISSEPCCHVGACPIDCVVALEPPKEIDNRGLTNVCMCG